MSTDTLTTVLSEAVAVVAPEVVLEDAAIAAIASSAAMVNMVVADPTLDPLSDVATDIVESAQEDLQTSVADVVSGEVSVVRLTQRIRKSYTKVVIVVDALDTDGDGIADALDTDDDGDGVADGKDAFSKDATESTDTDADGIGNADTDDDADGVLDTADAFHCLLGELTDTDGDGRPNNCDMICQNLGMSADADDDGDSVRTQLMLPLDKTETLDIDGDGIGNNADADDDGDGVADDVDVFPDKTETLDTDQDGIGNNADADDDGDGVADELMHFRWINRHQIPMQMVSVTTLTPTMMVMAFQTQEILLRGTTLLHRPQLSFRKSS